MAQLGGLHQLYKEAGPNSSGLNPFIRRAIKQNPEFMELMEATVQRIGHLADQGTAQVQVAVNCRWGKHRSVSFAVELHERLAALAPRFEPRTFHIERPRWDREFRLQHRMRSQVGIAYPIPDRFGGRMIRRSGGGLNLECRGGRFRHRAGR